MTKRNSSSTFPSLLHNPSIIRSPLPFSHTASKFCGHLLLCYTTPQAISPLARFPHIIRSKNQGISLPQNHHTHHRMLMEINGNYWVPVSHNGPTLEVLYQYIFVCSIPFTVTTNTCSQLQPPNRAFSCFPVLST